MEPDMKGPTHNSARLLLPLAVIAFCCNGQIAHGDESEDALPQVRFHLTARPFEPLGVEREDYLDVLEGLCRYLAILQDERGAIVDPYLQREHQYSTPYFAFAVGVLLEDHRATDLSTAGISAMEHATRSLAGGWHDIPDHHGEFFLAPLADALELYRPHVPEAVWAKWRSRLQTPLDRVLENLQGRINNWRTYAMKGEWLRQRAGLVTRDSAVAFIEDAWLRRTQRERIVPDRWNMYQDWSSDPQSLAVEAVGRGNLLALIASGYDGPHADEISACVYRGTLASLLWQDPSGQCPPNGRTDDHVFNDLLYQLAFEVMAEQSVARGDLEQAGRYRRAALLGFHSLSRWRRNAGEFGGSYFVTKNHFNPAERVGYQPASQYTNYNGTIAYHLAEAYRAHHSEIEEQPTSAEIGGYVVKADDRFASAVANAGGMQVFANLRGDTVPKYDRFWTPLGIVRFGRSGWDSRLGPSDGAHDEETGRAITFAPTWLESERWVRLSERAEHYRGTVTTEFVHPLLVRFQILYHTVTGVGGPSFRHEFIVTPDGVLTTLHCSDDRSVGLTHPILVDDGRSLRVERTSNRVTVTYPPDVEPSGDEQNFLILSEKAQLQTEDKIRSAVGWLEPVRVTSGEPTVRVFVYPRTKMDPTGAEVLESFRMQEDGFTSCLAEVNGKIYSGHTAVGGETNHYKPNNTGLVDLRFDRPCLFVLQHAGGVPIQLEVDRDVAATYADQSCELKAFTPIHIPHE